MSRNDSRGFGCGTLIMLLVALLGIWSLALGQPIWEWVR